MLKPPSKTQKMQVNIVTPSDDYIPDFYWVHHCGYQNVTDALSEEIPFWEPRNPILICAPTGKGKSHFFKTVLIPDALEKGKTMLIISNRIALTTQQKREILEILDSPQLRYLTDEGLRNTECFGSVAIITYHRLPAFLGDPKNAEFLDDLLYVVADECHLLTSDSSFNESCNYYLKLLTTRFHRAIRVYMTATPWDVLYPLAEAEQSNWLRFESAFNPYLQPRSFNLYQFDASYDHVTLEFFQELDEIRERIQEDSQDKWMVFVDNKEVGKAFAESLPVKTLYLDADSKGKTEWLNVVKNQKFDARVLVTTPALDCGINIWDKQLKHVCVITDDRTAFIQMVGRKRCSPGEKFTVHVMELSNQKLGARYARAQEMLDFLEAYEESDRKKRQQMSSRIWNDENSELRKYFQLGSGNLYYNKLAFHKLRRKFRFYQQLKDREIGFQDAVCGWLGKSEEPAPTQNREVLLSFCQSNEDRELDDDTFDILRQLVIKAASDNGFYEDHPERLPDMGYDGVNHRLKYLGLEYSVIKSSKKLWLRKKQESTPVR